MPSQWNRHLMGAGMHLHVWRYTTPRGVYHWEAQLAKQRAVLMPLQR